MSYLVGSYAHPAGFEPTACRLGGGRSILLSYGCIEAGERFRDGRIRNPG